MVADPLRVSVSVLRRRLGQTMPFSVHYQPPVLQVIASRTSGEPITGELTLDSIERGITVTGVVTVPWSGECRRCLDAVGGIQEMPINEIFQMGATGDDDLIDFDGETIDLNPVIRDTALLALPLSPLCRADCAGPDPDRYRTGIDGERVAVEGAEASESVRDPRWSALDQLDLN